MCGNDRNDGSEVSYLEDKTWELEPKLVSRRNNIVVVPFVTAVHRVVMSCRSSRERAGPPGQQRVFYKEKTNPLMLSGKCRLTWVYLIAVGEKEERHKETVITSGKLNKASTVSTPCQRLRRIIRVHQLMSIIGQNGVSQMH